MFNISSVAEPGVGVGAFPALIPAKFYSPTYRSQKKLTPTLEADTLKQVGGEPGVGVGAFPTLIPAKFYSPTYRSQKKLTPTLAADMLKRVSGEPGVGVGAFPALIPATFIHQRTGVKKTDSNTLKRIL